MIDTDKEIIELNYQLIRTQLIFDHIINNTPNITPPSADNMKDMDSEALESLKNKYPDIGIFKT